MAPLPRPRRSLTSAERADEFTEMEDNLNAKREEGSCNEDSAASLFRWSNPTRSILILLGDDGGGGYGLLSW
jgi:hypothetical protein